MWPECVHDFRRFEDVPKIANEVAAIAQELRLDNDEPHDMNELLESHSQPPTSKNWKIWLHNSGTAAAARRRARFMIKRNARPAGNSGWD